jgi:hypothetical protein
MIVEIVAEANPHHVQMVPSLSNLASIFGIAFLCRNLAASILHSCTNVESRFSREIGP